MLQYQYNFLTYGQSFQILTSEYHNKLLFRTFDLAGIYKIVNNVTKDVYIGQSKNVSKRLLTHLQLLRNNQHKYKNGNLSLLQKSWNKYQEESFSWEIVEFCDEEDLNDKEIYWIAYYKCNHVKYRQRFNTTDGGQGTKSAFSKSTKGYLAIYKDGAQKKVPPEKFEEYLKNGWVHGTLPATVEKGAKSRIGKYTGENSPNFGKRWHLTKPRPPVSEETKAKISKANKGKTGSMKGKKHSEETKKKISKSLKGRTMSQESIEKSRVAKYKPIVQLTKDDKFVAEFESAIEAQEKTGVNRTHIASCCNGSRKTTRGYKWMFKEKYINELKLENISERQLSSNF